MMKKIVKLITVALLTAFCLTYTGCDFIQSLMEKTLEVEQTPTDDTTATDNPDNPNTGDPNTEDPGKVPEPEPTDNPNSSSTETTTSTTPPHTKTLSTWTSGVRNINITSKAKGNGIQFKSTVSPAPKTDYSVIDSKVKNLTISTTTTIADAANQIVSAAGASTVKEKVRALYTWMAYNIDYEYESSDMKKYTAAGAFEDRKAVCAGFSYLMEAMCKELKIDNVVVSGCAKYIFETDTAQRDANIFVDNHAWNLIKDDAGNFLVDVTWASNYQHSKLGDYTIWFATDPCYFIGSHFPMNDIYLEYTQEEAQLISPPLTSNEFITLPGYNPDIENIGIDGKELLEFLATHLDSWMPPRYAINTDGAKTEIYSLPLAHSLVKNTEYEISFGQNGKYTTQKFKPEGTSYTPAYHAGNFSVQYMTTAALSTVRDNPSEWKKSNVAGEEIKIKDGVTGKLNSNGKIEIDEKEFNKSGFIPVVKKGEIATVEGNLPVTDLEWLKETYGKYYPEDYDWDQPGAYTYLYSDSAFPEGRKVRFSAFEMAKYPVTVELYKKVMESIQGFGGLTEPSYRTVVWPVLKEGMDDDGKYPYLGLWQKDYCDKYNTGLTYDRYELIVTENSRNGVLICDYKPPYNSEEEYLNDYVTGISLFDAIYFCNALTTLLMGKEHCVYTLYNIEWSTGPNPEGIASDVDTKYKTKISETLGFPEENIITMHYEDFSTLGLGEDVKSKIHRKTLTLDFIEDYTKKGFRLPTDAEWEFAARGADPKSAEWSVEHMMTDEYGKENSIGLVDIFGKNRFGPWNDYHYAPTFDSEYVMDWLTANRDYEKMMQRADWFASSSHVDDQGYACNPLFLGNCRSIRYGTSSRKMVNNHWGVGTIYRLRLVRNLD